MAEEKEVLTVDPVARENAAVALAKISEHEKSCDERMKEIRADMGEMKENIGGVNSRMTWLLRSVIVACFAIIAQLIVFSLKTNATP